MEFLFERGNFPNVWGAGNVFIIGKTKSAKTSFAEWVVSNYPEYDLISASGWIKSQFPPTTSDYAAYVQFLSTESERQLSHDPDKCIKYVSSKMQEVFGGMWVVEGVRNPRDFCHMFDYRHDFVFFIENPSHEFGGAFDDGVSVIQEYVQWLSTHMGFDNFDKVVVK